MKKAAGEIIVKFKKRTEPDVKKGDHLSIGFRVNDLDLTVAALREKGIAFRLHDDNQVRLAMFTDPDSNELYLAQSKW